MANPSEQAPANGINIFEILNAIHADTNALNDGTRAQPGQGAPAATQTLGGKIDDMHKFMRNRVTSTATQINVYNDDTTTIDHKATLADDNTTASRTEFVSGP